MLTTSITIKCFIQISAFILTIKHDEGYDKALKNYLREITSKEGKEMFKKFTSHLLCSVVKV